MSNRAHKSSLTHNIHHPQHLTRGNQKKRTFSCLLFFFFARNISQLLPATDNNNLFKNIFFTGQFSVSQWPSDSKPLLKYLADLLIYIHIFTGNFAMSCDCKPMAELCYRTCQIRRTSDNSTVYCRFFFTAICFEWNSKLFAMIINRNYPCHNLLIGIESRHRLYLSHFRLAFRNITQCVWWDHTLVWLQMGRCYLSGGEEIHSLERQSMSNSYVSIYFF